MSISAEWVPGFTGIATETLLNVRRASTGCRISKVEFQQYLEEVAMYTGTQLSMNGNVLTLKLKWMGQLHSFDLTEIDGGDYSCPVQLGVGTHLILL
ncbi:hypothetical protein LCG56_28000 (plasmid) [Pseudomonas cannabina pv. alisalensis]|uniref:Uncharacterized protein n=1 Tax=Pseudomonas syringae pv. maculicola str. ES4326 TaxID=629265 RepID=A0A8T8CBR7_PSEYM|nr:MULTISPECIES: hypothetical protein [Pseudomonas syringae group]QHF00614.1 hypothetical protein PMA4326_029375 [Pseudomonas syringae pv. maculicola str. ES4326]UBZ00606.1 hypothetical protein LCG56_28000 [Pseudomonas cannabina pv. alisalensis]